MAILEKMADGYYMDIKKSPCEGCREHQNVAWCWCPLYAKWNRKRIAQQALRPPKNPRNVLTWVRNNDGSEHWQIDSYAENIGWLEAKGWDQEVLFWTELPDAPQDDKE